MPKGMPSSQTKASDRYQKKVGLISKSYKLKKDIVDEFAEACEKAGIPQSVAITDFMVEFIKNNRT